MKIVLDTNFLLIPFQYRVDIYSEFQRLCSFKYKLYILDKTIKELEKLREGKEKKLAEMALLSIKKYSIDVIKTNDEKYTDDALLELSNQPEVLVATQDSELRKKLKNAIYLRQKKYLMIKNVLPN